MARHWTCMEAEQTALASARERESKNDTTAFAGRMELPFAKMGETIRRADMGGCEKHKDLCFRHVKFTMPARQGWAE